MQHTSNAHQCLQATPSAVWTQPEKLTKWNHQTKERKPIAMATDLANDLELVVVGLLEIVDRVHQRRLAQVGEGVGLERPEKAVLVHVTQAGRHRRNVPTKKQRLVARGR